MLFGRLRVPLDREPTVSADRRTASGFYVIPVPRGETPRRPLSVVPPPPSSQPSSRREDEYAGLDRLDREELDE
jgi:hypothetical protein